MSSYRKFVVIAQARSGSWWLTKALGSHPHVVCAGELYTTDPEQRRRGYVAATGMPEYGTVAKQAILNGDLDSFLWKAMRFKNPEASALGFKVLYEHMGQPYGDPKISLALDDSIMLVHLTRENPFHCMASWWLAVVYADWNGKIPFRQVTISPAAAEIYLERRRQCEADVRLLCEGREHVNVAYEDMLTDLPAAVAPVFAKLNLPIFVPMKHAIVDRQDARPLSQKIGNLDQLREHFAGTSWSRYLTQTSTES